jgi:hypothetical protein
LVSIARTARGLRKAETRSTGSAAGMRAVAAWTPSAGRAAGLGSALSLLRVKGRSPCAAGLGDHPSTG